jgi:hypothetical protein
MTVAEGGGIFVSYRRQDTSHLAGRLYDRLASALGEENVFIDVDMIQLGEDFAEAISRAVTACEVLLAVIGPNWRVWSHCSQPCHRSSTRWHSVSFGSVAAWKRSAHI